MCGRRLVVVSENSVPYNGAQTPRQGISIPASVTAQSNAVSVAVVGCFSHSGRDVPLVELNGTANLAFGKRQQTGIDSLTVKYGAAWAVPSRFQPALAGMFVGYSSAASGLTIYGSDRKVSSLAALAGTPLAGGVIGISTSAFVAGDNVTTRDGGGMFGAVLIYGQGLDSSQMAALRQSTLQWADLRPQVRGNVYFDADSITDGAFGNLMESTPRRIARMLLRPANIYNFAISGGTVESQQAAYLQRIAPAYDTAAPYNLFVLSGLGTNNLGATTPQSAAEVYAKLVVYCQLIRQTFPWLMVGTIRPRGAFIGTDKETQRLALNAMIRVGWATDMQAHGLIDYSLTPTIGGDLIGQDARYYPDGTHQSDLARAIEAAFVAPQIDTLVTRLG